MAVASVASVSSDNKAFPSLRLRLRLRSTWTSTLTGVWQKEEEDGKSFYNVVDRVSIESLRKMSQRIIRHFVEVIFLVMFLERKPV